MTASAGRSLESLKRRQALQVAGFLILVAAGTIGLFHALRGDLVAYRNGQDALRRGDFALAAARLEEAWNRGYQLPRVRLELARALLETGRRDEALIHYEAAWRATPGDLPLLDTVAGLYQGRGEPALAIELYASLGPPEQLAPGALVRLGDLLQQAGRYEEAAGTYGLAARRVPGEAEIHLRLGIVLAWLGRRPEAIAALRQAVTLQPDHRLAQLYLARVLLWDGRFAEAVTEYRRALPE